MSLWVAAVLILCTAVAFAVVYVTTGSELRAAIDRDLLDDSAQLSRFVATLSGQSPAHVNRAAGTYVRAEPYSATSRLVFIIVPGQPPQANHEELFGNPPADRGETAGQQRAENREAAALIAARLGFSTGDAPDVGPVRVLKDQVALGHFAVIIGEAEPLSPVDHAQHSVARAFLLASLAALVLAFIASYLAGAHVSAPLRRMAAIAARVNEGDLTPRMDTAVARGGEVGVLADSFNRMLARLQAAFTRQRSFVADASHELRTPLTVIRGQLEVLASEDAPSATDVRHVERIVGAEVERMSRLVDDLLLLARTESTESLRPARLALPAFVHELWARVEVTAERHFELGRVPAGVVLADPDRLSGALRNLVRNAVEHTRAPVGLVRLDVEADTDTVAFTVSDDGPGIPAEERERVFERFHRTDRGRARDAGGAGLGLAIVRAVAEAHGGQAQVLPGPPEGGTRVQIVLPGFTAADR